MLRKCAVLVFTLFIVAGASATVVHGFEHDKPGNMVIAFGMIVGWIWACLREPKPKTA